MASPPGPSGPYQGAYTPRSEVLAAGGLTGSVNRQPVPNQNLVYMGPMFKKRPKDIYYGSTTTAASTAQAEWGQTVWTTDVAKSYFLRMDPELRARVNRAATTYLGWSRPTNMANDRWVYEQAVDEAANQSMLTGQMVSVWDVLDRYAEGEYRPDGGGTGGGGYGGGGGGGPTASVQLTNASDARVLVDQALNQYLGRQATEKEASNFWGLLNQTEAANPRVSQVAGDTAITSGGVNPQQAAKEFAMSRKDAAEFMANTQYMDWFMNKIASDPTEGVASGL